MLAGTKWLQIPALVTGLLLSTAAVSFGQSPTELKHLDAAMQALKKAASELQAAGGGFGGHRAKAQELIKQAEGELREARAWAKTHPDKK